MLQDLEIRNRHRKRILLTLYTPERTAKGVVVLVHGLAGWKDQRVMVAVAEAARTCDYYVLTFDAANGLHGPDGTVEDDTTTHFIEDLEDVMEFAQQQSWWRGDIVLAGHSLGAVCVVRYARIYPTAAHRLLLIAPAISWHLEYGLPFIIRIPGKIVYARTRDKSFSREQGMRVLIPFYPPWVLDFFKYDVALDAPFIALPVCIISAGRDVIVSEPPIHSWLATRFPDAQHYVIDHASHAFEKRELELAATISSWLTSS